MAKNNFKNRDGVVYSTNQEFDYQYNQEEELETLPIDKQKLLVKRDAKGRGGKVVTLITGFVGSSADLESLAKQVKNKMGVGGSAKDHEIIIQGDFRERVVKVLTDLGYKAK